MDINVLSIQDKGRPGFVKRSGDIEPVALRIREDCPLLMNIAVFSGGKCQGPAALAVYPEGDPYLEVAAGHHPGQKLHAVCDLLRPGVRFSEFVVQPVGHAPGVAGQDRRHIFLGQVCAHHQPHCAAGRGKGGKSL